jgi:hypothetical protein
MPDRNQVADIKAAANLLYGPITVVDVIDALYQAGYPDIAANVLEMQRQRVIGDYLQTSAIFDKEFRVLNALNDPNDYQGPGSGYRLSGERWEQLADLPQAWDPRAYLKNTQKQPARLWLEEVGPAKTGTQTEVVVAVGPAFGAQIDQTINGLDHRLVLSSILDGIHSQDVVARVIRVYHTSDCAFIGYAGAQLSGSGVAIGIQSKGTTVIHQQNLAPLDNLELFPQAPNLDLGTYHQIGVNAALYAQTKPAIPVPD